MTSSQFTCIVFRLDLESALKLQLHSKSLIFEGISTQYTPHKMPKKLHKRHCVLRRYIVINVQRCSFLVVCYETSFSSSRFDAARIDSPCLFCFSAKVSISMSAMFAPLIGFSCTELIQNSWTCHRTSRNITRFVHCMQRSFSTVC